MLSALALYCSWRLWVPRNVRGYASTCCRRNAAIWVEAKHPASRGVTLRVLVLWARPEGTANLGVRVLAEGASSLLKTALGPDTEIDFIDFGSGIGGTSLTRKAMLVDGLVPGVAPITKLLAQYDMVVDTGAGDSFTDHYGIQRLAQMAFVKRAARRVGAPLVLAPQTIGPFNTSIGRWLGRAGLRGAALVIARDSASAEAATRLGRSVDLVATDLVFALPSPEPSNSTHEVVLNVSGLLWRENPHVDYGAYRSLIHSLIGGLVDRGTELTLLAHVIDLRAEAGPDNDVPAVLALTEQYSASGVKALVPGSLGEVRSELASAGLLIGSRMHACLNALSVGTPAVPLAYSRKFAPLLSDLGWDLSLDLRDGSSHASRIFEIIDDPDRVSSMRDLAISLRSTATLRLDEASSLVADVAARG